jgi:hypothetical protein
MRSDVRIDAVSHVVNAALTGLLMAGLGASRMPA